MSLAPAHPDPQTPDLPPPEPQTLAADPRASVFVTANAGSGKTSTLVNRVARALLAGSRPEAMLCVTYTKAAAAEMQRRLFETLGDWAVAADDALAGKLARLEDRPAAAFDAEHLARARRLFARALETPGGLKIQTIHAFCETLLRRFPLEAGVSPGFEVLEDAAAAEVSARARDAVALMARDAPDGPVAAAYAHFAVELDYQSFEGMFAAFEARREAIARYADACAARGDTVAEDIWRVCGFHEPDDPEALEAEAAGVCAWAEWTEAVEHLLASGPQDQELARKLAGVVECSRASGHTFDQCWAAFSTGKGEPSKRLGAKALDPRIRDWLLAEQTRLHEACGRVQAARIARDSVHALTLAAAYGAMYRLEKARTGRLDFDDLIATSEVLLTERADAAWVLYKLDGGIDHVLVDEAQDTSPGQWAILRALTAEFFAGAGAPRRLPPASGDAPRTVFAVGDEKQSIYSFQGAAPERLLEETRVYDALVTGAGEAFRTVPLVTSWRSTPQVLGFVDAVFADPETRAAVPPPAGEDVVRHVAGRADDPGCVDLWPLEQEAKSDPTEAWDAPLDAPAADGAYKRLARRIARWIVDAGARGEAVWDKAEQVWRPVQPGDVLILVRRRKQLFEEIIRELKKAGVPVAGADRLRLSDHVVFQDLLALCRFCLYPNDDLTLAGLLRSPFCDVDEDGLFDLSQGREGTLWRALNARADERPAWAAAKSLLGWAQGEARERSPFDFLARVLARLDAERRSVRSRILTRLGREAQDAMDEVLALALALERSGVRDLERFTAALERSDVEVKRELEGASGQVRVMTVHGAKGLEAPVVILPDTATRAKGPRAALLRTEDGGFLFAPRSGEDCSPSGAARAALDAAAARESLRLLYVALTRARDRLIICGRINAVAKGAEAGSWYAAAAAAFDRPEIARASRVADESGGALRRYGPDPARVSPPVHLAKTLPAFPSWTLDAVPVEAPERAYASPSDLAERKRGPAPSPLSAAGGVGRWRRGELIHRLLQLLPDLPVAERDAAAARLLSKERDLDDAQRAEMAAAALGVLSDPVFAEVFGPGSRAEAAVAGGAPGLPLGLAVSGRVDRMLVTPERVLVVDFKTNRPAPRAIEDADEAYRVQMAVYVAVLRAIFPGRRVEAALVWTDGPRLMAVPEKVVAETLAALPRRD